ncbi:ATP-binding protein [Dialister sp.]|uniref:ATP-binding protein n=1 Tax=Dialister sp. TaxID=1955814 RepID=UPI002E81E9BE|nr:ATP-binding protein [Dialister sp.]MEE3453739.1 ATP-binding protein [Dialister sp.]
MEIKRELYLERLKNRMHNGLIKVITGIRRSGKSYLLFVLFRRYLLQSGVPENHIIAMELDRYENREYRRPGRLLSWIRKHVSDKGDYYILLDEVQLLENFEEVLNSLLYEKNLDVYVTGSNSKFLSKDVITEFRGRGDEVHIFPLSFDEFMSVYEGDEAHGWADYMTYGGLPLISEMKTDEQKMAYLINLFEETYLVDILERNRLDKRPELEDLLNVLASSVGSLTNPTKIEATFQSVLHSSISKNTIIKYLEYLKDAFIIREARRFDVKGRKYIGTPLKYYFEDVGLRNARLGFRQQDRPHLVENILYNELRLRGFQVDVGNVKQRFMDKETGSRLSRTLEIDFVANRGSRRYYIQSAWAIPSEEKMEQEKASLLALDDSFKKIIIVNEILRPFQDENGILTLGLFDFLRHRDSLEW